MAFKFSREPQTVKPVSTENRYINTSIPCPGTLEILEELDNFESRSMHGQIPIVWDSAEDLISLISRRINLLISHRQSFFRMLVIQTKELSIQLMRCFKNNF